jgi:hypothetical protein
MVHQETCISGKTNTNTESEKALLEAPVIIEPQRTHSMENFAPVRELIVGEKMCTYYMYENCSIVSWTIW